MDKLPPTPETDALNRNLIAACRDEYIYSEMLAFAQKLERQRNELNAALLAMHEYYREFTIKGSLTPAICSGLGPQQPPNEQRLF